MSEPQEDLTGMWLDVGSPRQVLGPCASPYDDIWRVRYPSGLPGLKSSEFIRLNWMRVPTDGAA